MADWNYLFCHNCAKIQLSMMVQKGNKIMNNQEIEQALNKVEHPDNKLLQPIAWWVNSATGLLSDIAALIIAISAVIAFDNKQVVLFNWILSIAGLYIVIYELFDLAILKQAITKDRDEFVTAIEYSLIVIVPATIWMFLFIYNKRFLGGNRGFLIGKSALVIDVYILQILIWGLRLREPEHETQNESSFILSYLFQIKCLYLKCKFKNNA